MPRRYAGEVARQAGGGVTGRKGGKGANLLPELFGEGGAAWRKWVAEIAQIARTLLAARGPQRLTGVGGAPILPHRKNGLKSWKLKVFKLRGTPVSDPSARVKPTCFQELILALQDYWARQGCLILQP